MNTLEEDGLLFMELPTPARVGNHYDIGVLVAVVCARTQSVLAVAEVELPCDGGHGLQWVALRSAGCLGTVAVPSKTKLMRWEAGVRKLLDGVFRDDRGRRD